MKKTLVLRLLVSLVIVALVAGCAPAATPETVEVVKTVVVTEVVEQPGATTVVEKVITATPEAMETEEMGPIPIQFRLNWTLYGEHAPFFVGVDKGFYAEEGLDVEIQEGSGSATVVKLIGNATNVLGYADSATMMSGVTKGIPVKAVAVLLQTSPMSFIHRADAARPTSLEDLPGSKIAITSGDASLNIFNACLQKNGLTIEDVETIVVGNPAAKETAVLEGQADSFLGYYIDQPLRMEKVTGVDMAWKTLYELCDVSTLSSAVIVNTVWAADHPEVVEKFVRATQRAVQYTMDNPEEAAEIFASHAEAFDEELSLVEIKGALDLLYTPNSEGQPIGWSAEEDWVATQDLLAEYSGLTPEEDINVYFSNEYISEAPYTP
jgi:NitT/TauT family transport system substrate-binding protein